MFRREIPFAAGFSLGTPIAVFKNNLCRRRFSSLYLPGGGGSD
jgi:hypothetical protein